MSSTVSRRHKESAGNCNQTNRNIGLCLSCGHRVTLCGRTFTAEIECPNCKKMNIFTNSQQPVAVKDTEIDGLL